MVSASLRERAHALNARAILGKSAWLLVLSGVIAATYSRAEEAEPKLSGVVPFPGSLRVLASGEAPDEYEVQRGDTLFDICDQLIDEPGYWPKLWAINPEIKNPHFIVPGMKIRFFPGDLELPPYLQIIAEPELPLNRDKVDQSDFVYQLLPKEGKAYEPPALEVVDDVQISSEIEASFEEAGSIFVATTLSVELPGFVLREAPTSLGRVLGSINGKLISEPDTEIILSSDKLAPASIVTIIRPEDLLHELGSGKSVGTHYAFVAHARIVSAPGSREGQVARVTAARLPVEEGDWVIEFRKTRQVLPLVHLNRSATSSINSEVVHIATGMSLCGPGGIVYLSGGAPAGFARGQYHKVYTSTAFRKPGTEKLPFWQQQLGILHILDVTDSAAAAYVIESSDLIGPGATTTAIVAR